MEIPGTTSTSAEPEGEEPPDELDPELLARMVAESDEWLRHGPDWPDAEPRAPGTTGPDLLNAAWDTLISDDLSQLTDAELIEQAQAARDLAAMATGRQYRTLTELLRRRPPQMKSRRFEVQDAGRDEEEGIEKTAPNRPQFPVMPSEEAAGEIALAFTLTDYGAGIITAMTADLARRLPCALEGLEAGHLDESRVKIIWEYSRDLSDDDAARLDGALSPVAGEMTTGELRDKARREQIRIDPGAAEKRRKRGERASKVVLYPNDDHTATLAIERAPAALAAAAKSRVSAIARAAKASGAKDDLSLLESKVSLGLLTGTLDVIPPPEPPDNSPGPGDGPEPGDPGTGGDDGTGPGEPQPEDPAPGHFRPGQSMPWPTIPGTAGAAAPGCAVIPPAYRPEVPGRVRLLVPWRTLAGIAGEPGDMSWFGAVTPGQAQELARAAAADPSAAWRVIVTGDDGRAIAVTTLGRRSRADSTAPGLVEEITVTIQASIRRRALQHRRYQRRGQAVGPGPRPSPHREASQHHQRRGPGRRRGGTPSDAGRRRGRVRPYPRGPRVPDSGHDAPSALRPRPHLPEPGLPPSRQPMRHRPHPRLRARRTDLPMQYRGPVPASSPAQAVFRMEA